MPAEPLGMADATLGFDLGGTKLLAALLDGAGRIVAQQRIATPDGAPARVIDAMATLAAELAARAPAVVARAAGIGFPGLVDVARGVARSSVILREWREVPLAAQLSQRLRLPVALDNDVHQAARAERAVRGAAERDFLFLTVGTGIGGALVLRGELWPGAEGLAGEIGHLSVDRDGPECACGRRGCIGVVASGGAIERQLGLAKGGLAAAAAAGDPRVTAALAEAAAALGGALASAINLLALPLVVVGGGVVELDGRFVAAVEAALRRDAMAEIGAATRVERARCGYEAGALGAALHARGVARSASE
ncbi:MAG: ROK family protein [Planctomycetes bacterium]|nr:ROK family protein [Planctomycetota bacterium]